MKPVIISGLMLICIAFGVALVPVCERLDRVFSSSEPGLATSPAVGPVHILSTIDLQRELNRRYPKPKVGDDGVYGPLTELEEDGVYGPLTEAAHVRAIGDQYAQELMVREIR